MGKANQGVFGNFSGKVGNVVGRIREGRNVYAIYQPVVNNPQTISQKRVRQQLQLISQFCSKCLGFLQKGFGDLDGYKYGSAYSSAVGKNLKETLAISGTYPNQQIAFDKVLLAYGSLDNPYTPTATAENGELSVGWTDNTGLGNAEADDEVMLLAYNSSKHQSVYNLNAAARSDRSAVLTLPATWSGDSIEGYMAMYKDAKRMASKSIHLGSFTA